MRPRRSHALGSAILRMRRRGCRRMARGALLLLLSLPLRLHTLALLRLPLLCLSLLRFPLLSIALLLRGALLLLVRGPGWRREVVRLPGRRGRGIAIVARCITAEHDARVQRSLANCGGAVGW